MEPPRRPGEGGSDGDGGPRKQWVDPGYSKYAPGTTPTPHPSRITRTYPEPALLTARRSAAVGTGAGAEAAAGGVGSTRGGGAAAARRGGPKRKRSRVSRELEGQQGVLLEEDEEEEEEEEEPAAAEGGYHLVENDEDADHAPGEGKVLTIPRENRPNPLTKEADTALMGRKAMINQSPCPVCQEPLPDEERGILACNHVFCFTCVHTWSKKETCCPICRKPFSHITKTMSQKEIEQHNARRDFDPETVLTKKQRGRLKRTSIQFKKPRPLILTKNVRTRPKSQRQHMAYMSARTRHPQAPAGSRNAAAAALQHWQNNLPMQGYAHLALALSAAAAAANTPWTRETAAARVAAAAVPARGGVGVGGTSATAARAPVSTSGPPTTAGAAASVSSPRLGQGGSSAEEGYLEGVQVQVGDEARGAVNPADAHEDGLVSVLGGGIRGSGSGSGSGGGGNGTGRSSSSSSVAIEGLLLFARDIGNGGGESSTRNRTSTTNQVGGGGAAVAASGAPAAAPDASC